MTNEQYLAVLADLRNRQNALDQEKAQLNQDYLDSLPFKVGDEVYYTPSFMSSTPELKGIVFKAEVSAVSIKLSSVSIYYTVCPPTKGGTLPKVARNAIRGTEENLKLRKVGFNPV